jgi:hypothetical protein
MKLEKDNIMDKSSYETANLDRVLELVKSIDDRLDFYAESIRNVNANLILLLKSTQKDDRHQE